MEKSAREDSLLTPESRQFETILNIQDDVKIDQFPCQVQFVHAAQLPDFWRSKNMDAALFNPIKATEITACMRIVREYYQNIDAGNLEAVRNLFVPDSYSHPFPFRRYPESLLVDAAGNPMADTSREPFIIDHIRQETRYLRADQAMTSYDQIAKFYSPEGRKLHGEHVIQLILGIRGLVFAFGLFAGEDYQGKYLEKQFGDVWHFGNGIERIAERRTYLESPPETLLTRTHRTIMARDLMDQITLALITDSNVIAEIRGFPHNPDLAHLAVKRGSAAKHYFNVDGEIIQ